MALISGCFVRLTGCCLVFLLCFQLTAGDTEALPDFSNLTLQELAAVKITSVSKGQQSLSQAAAAVYVISQEEINRSGMTNVPDLLRLVPGLSVARIDGSKWAVSSRGFNSRFSNKLLVLIDGRSVYSPIFSGVYWDLGMPLLGDIDRIEVIRGPGASVWGADAVNGVINIITKSAGQQKGGAVSAGGGTSERGFGEVRFGGSMAGGIDYRVYLSGNDMAASPTGNGQNAHDGWADWQAGFRLDGTTPKGGWQLEGDLFQDRRQEVGVLPSPQADYANTPIAGEFTGTSSSLGFQWHRSMTENSELRVTTSFDFINRPETGLPVLETKTGDFEIQYRFVPMKHHQATIGLADRLISDRTPASGPVSFDPSQLTYQVASGFVQDEIHLLNDRLLLTFGGILEHDLFAGWLFQPTARALWAPNKQHSVWISASQAARAPTLYERDVVAEFGSVPGTPATFNLPTMAAVTGSPKFQSEILRAYEIGYRAQPSPRLSIDLTAFYDDYSHLSTEDPGVPAVAGGAQPYLQVPFYFSNRLTAQAPGGEISLMYHPVSQWKLAGSYGYINEHSRLDANAPRGVINTSPNAFPTHQWKIQSYLNLSKSMKFDTFVFSSSSVVSPIYPYGEFLIPAHTRVDARLGWRVTPRFELSLSGQDLLSPRHVELLPEVLSVPGFAVRGYYLKTSWSF